MNKANKLTSLNNVRRLRFETQLTQRAFADVIGCALTSLTKIELGRLPLSERMAVSIGRTFGIEPAWLIENDLDSPVPAITKQVQVPKFGKRQPDEITVETGAMAQLYRVLLPLQEGARERVIRWVLNRLDETGTKNGDAE
jgi:transcriptional regulator with XRE-family HTH domain